MLLDNLKVFWIKFDLLFNVKISELFAKLSCLVYLYLDLIRSPSGFNPSHPVYFRIFFKNKNKLKCLFSHFFVVPQKVLWRPPELGWKGSSKLKTGSM